ncbi:unnamed protein product [marine sediment metagenome]|uniref:Uncharacterized protein n=1 Tax=marine sediment metagenome TaxID=412755 RepID=X1CLP9_9ZZZZ
MLAAVCSVIYATTNGSKVHCFPKCFFLFHTLAYEAALAQLFAGGALLRWLSLQSLVAEQLYRTGK